MSRIIAADDDLTLRHVYALMLDTLGHDAVICKDGKEAVTAFNEEPADLIILDINMPIMDGLTACREIRKTPDGIKVPIIIVSGNNSEDDITAGLNAGASDYLMKPLREAALIAKLKNFLKLSSLNRKDFDLVKNHVIFLDRYKIERVLGYGAHSVVFLADDQKKKTKAAIKLLNENVSDQATIKRFIELVSQYKKVKSDKIISILDYGQYGEQIYLVLEYAAQGDLRKRIMHGKLKEKEVAKLGMDVSKALMSLDKAGLNHLDLKPENIILQDDNFKLTDFGMATPRDTATIPLRTEIWSTVPYTCPEGFTGCDPLDIRSDIYSLGVTMYEAATGDNPFISDKSTLSMYRQVNLVPAEIKRTESGYCSELSDMICAMLHKDPANRPSLEQIHQWCEFIYRCHCDDATQQLTYAVPDLEEETNLEKEAEKEPRPRQIRGTRLAKCSPAKSDSMGNWLYKIYTMNSMKSIPLKNAVVLIFFLAVSVIAFNLLGMTVSKLFAEQYTPAQEDNLPALNTMCFKCSDREVRRTTDVNKVKCSKCKGNLGYALQCNACKKYFPFIPPDTSNIDDIDSASKTSQAAKKCPFCKSQNTTYTAPPMPKGRN